MKVAVVYNRPRLEGNDAALCSADVLTQVEAVRESLVELGHEPVLVALSRQDAVRLPATLRGAGVECAVNLCESLDEDNRLQGHVAVLYELAGVPYTGSDMLALSLTTDKYLAKRVMAAAGVPTPKFALYTGGGSLETEQLKFPVIAKPRFEDGSVGIEEDSVAADRRGLEAVLKRLEPRYGDILVEEYVAGRELYAALLGHPEAECLPVSEIDLAALAHRPYQVVGYRAKWVEESPEFSATPRLFPAEDAATRTVREVARRCFRLFGLRDYARVDVRLDAALTPHVLEVNANPCLSPEGGYAAALERAGISFRQFVERLLGYALARRAA